MNPVQRTEKAGGEFNLRAVRELRASSIHVVDSGLCTVLDIVCPVRVADSAAAERLEATTSRSWRTTSSSGAPTIFRAFAVVLDTVLMRAASVAFDEL
jgi:hypothetical protein